MDTNSLPQSLLPQHIYYNTAGGEHVWLQAVLQMFVSTSAKVLLQHKKKFENFVKVWYDFRKKILKSFKLHIFGCFMTVILFLK